MNAAPIAASAPKTAAKLLQQCGEGPVGICWVRSGGKLVQKPVRDDEGRLASDSAALSSLEDTMADVREK